MSRIYHLAEPDDWESACAAGLYDRSTRGVSLAEEGFIHCSDEDQWPRIRVAFYADVEGDLVLLEIDPELLDVPLVKEVGNRTTGEEFFHLYGALPVRAVVGTRTLAPPHGTT